MTIKEISRTRCFDGWHIRFSHYSDVNQCEMTAAIFLPLQAEKNNVPVLYWLSGLTCNDENFSSKAGAQQYAAKHGIALVAPDTSPRGEQVANDDAYDLGWGAGFYLSATEMPWSTHYHMDHYITSELPKIIGENFPINSASQAISGHSMGGHGALSLALKNPDLYQSVSAFSPICSPMNCPWGEKALTSYLGNNRETWKNYDSCYLIEQSANANKKFELLIEQGEADNFIDNELKPSLLLAACKNANYPINYRIRAGYDHSYYFIATFIAEHIAFHAQHLQSAVE